MDEDCLKLAKIDPEKMTEKEWVELLILKVKFEEYPIKQAINLIYKYVKLDLKKVFFDHDENKNCVACERNKFMKENLQAIMNLRDDPHTCREE